MTQRRYSHYTYSITNKASIVLLCVLIVAGGSLFIRGLLQTRRGMGTARWPGRSGLSPS